MRLTTRTAPEAEPVLAEARGRGSRAWLEAHLRDPLYRNSYLLLGSVIASAGGGFVFWLIAARLTDQDTVGRGSALVSAVGLISYLTSLGLPYGMLRHASRDEGLSRLLNACLLLSALSSLGAALIFVLGRRIWTPALSSLLDSPAEVLVFLAFTVASGLMVLLDNLFSARRRSGVTLLRSSAMSIGRVALIWVLFERGLPGVVLAASLPVIAVTAASLLALPRLVDSYSRSDVGDDPAVRSIMGFSLRAFPSTLLGGAPPFFMPLLALAVVGPQRTAVFYVAWSILSVLLVLPTVISNIALSEGARSRPWEAARRARLLALVVVLPIALAVAVLAHPVLSIFGGHYAGQGTTLLRLFMLSLLPWTFMVLASSALRGENRHWPVTASSASFAIATIALPTILGARLGLDGLGIGWTLGVTLAAVQLELHSRLGARGVA